MQVLSYLLWWLFHRHEYRTIWSFKFDNGDIYGVLEQCTCGQERAWTVYQLYRTDLEVRWIREHAKTVGKELI